MNTCQRFFFFILKATTLNQNAQLIRFVWSKLFEDTKVCIKALRSQWVQYMLCSVCVHVRALHGETWSGGVELRIICLWGHLGTIFVLGLPDLTCTPLLVQILFKLSGLAICCLTTVLSSVTRSPRPQSPCASNTGIRKCCVCLCDFHSLDLSHWTAKQSGLNPNLKLEIHFQLHSKLLVMLNIQCSWRLFCPQIIMALALLTALLLTFKATLTTSENRSFLLCISQTWWMNITTTENWNHRYRMCLEFLLHIISTTVSAVVG